MFIKVVKVFERWTNGERGFYLTEISLNSDHIAFLIENEQIKQSLKESKLGPSLHPSADFTDIKLSSGKKITVVGSRSLIESKILKSNRKILRD